MQPNLDQRAWRTSEAPKLWLEQEDSDELKKVEELKKKQALEKEVAEKRRKPQEQKEQAARPVH